MVWNQIYQLFNELKKNELLACNWGQMECITELFSYSYDIFIFKLLLISVLFLQNYFII